MLTLLLFTNHCFQNDTKLQNQIVSIHSVRGASFWPAYVSCLQFSIKLIWTQLSNGRSMVSFPFQTRHVANACMRQLITEWRVPPLENVIGFWCVSPDSIGILSSEEYESLISCMCVEMAGWFGVWRKDFFVLLQALICVLMRECRYLVCAAANCCLFCTLTVALSQLFGVTVVEIRFVFSIDHKSRYVYKGLIAKFGYRNGDSIV